MPTPFIDDEKVLQQKIWIMLADTPVMSFDINAGVYEVYRPDLLPVRLRGDIRQHSKGESNQQYAAVDRHNYNAVIDFMASRVMSFSRSNAKKLYDAYGIVSQSQAPESRAKVCAICHGLSAGDSYWLKPDSNHEKWKDMNVRQNHLSKILMSIALGNAAPTLEGRPRTPEFMDPGSYARAWKRYDDGLYLLKKSTPGKNESETEVEVSNILDCFSVDHVKYLPDTFEGSFVCRCKDMADEERSIIPASHLMKYCITNDIDFMSAVRQIDPNMFYTTCVVDYLVSNPDRHIENWGFYVDNSTGKITGMHPLFDHNNAFSEEDMSVPDGGASKLVSGHSKREVAIYAIKRCDFRCVKPVERRMFQTKAHYESFMQRAVELGLYRSRKLSLTEKIGIKHGEKYEPIKIDLNPNEDLLKKGDIDKILKTEQPDSCESSATKDRNNDVAYKPSMGEAECLKMPVHTFEATVETVIEAFQRVQKASKAIQVNDKRSPKAFKAARDEYAAIVRDVISKSPENARLIRDRIGELGATKQNLKYFDSLVFEASAPAVSLNHPENRD